MAVEPLCIVPYDPRWPRLFEAEREHVEAVLGAGAVAVEHVGSMSVPGLDAKPVVDPLVGLGPWAMPGVASHPRRALGTSIGARPASGKAVLAQASRGPTRLTSAPDRPWRRVLERASAVSRPPAGTPGDRRGVRSAKARVGRPPEAQPCGLHRREGALREGRAGAGRGFGA